VELIGYAVVELVGNGVVEFVGSTVDEVAGCAVVCGSAVVELPVQVALAFAVQLTL